MFFANSIIGNVFAILVTLAVIVIGYCKWSFQYWKRRNVPYLQPYVPFGNVTDALRGKENIGVSIQKLYNEMKSKNWKHGGIYIFSSPNYFPIDLDYVKNIMTKDFQHFVDREVFVNETEPLHAHLPNLSGTKWKNLRAKITPTFTSGKMKMMFQVMAELQDSLLKRMDAECLKNTPIDIKDILTGFTTNIIGSCVLGLDCNALEDQDSVFRDIGKKLFTMTKLRRFKRTFTRTFPKVSKFLNLSKNKKELENFFIKVISDTIDYREKNNYKRNDFMQLLINLKNKKPINSGDHDGKPLTFDEVASQCVEFFAAGLETSSTLMTFALYELGKHEDIQQKLRNEINSVLATHGEQLTYDSILEMKYLTQVIDESLRKHPPAAVTHRKCVKDYKVPNEDVIIEEGTSVKISILGIHNDETIYPKPEKFDPERFSDENRKSRHHYAFIPFGEGPRSCIGNRFGLMQSKIGLVCLVKNYQFTVNSKTQEPLFYQPNHIFLAAQGGIWLNASKI